LGRVPPLRRVVQVLLDGLEQEAEEKSGVQQVLAEHFAKIYKVSLPLAAKYGEIKIGMI
jgi:hypothetical protein